jgi:16S rRNA (cytosine967-C5)-methyltransferase
MLLENLQGKRVLDIGAAPGGKTMQLVKMGADVTALDKSPKRLKRLEENLARTGLKANILCTGVLDYTPDALFDAIVLDAPCSATGTMKRHPEIAVLKQQEDVDALKMIQRDMLKKAVEFLIPEGEMIYCVCSLQPEEGEQQMDWVSEHLSQLELIPLAVEANSWPDEYITARGELRVLPHYLQSHGGMDGFFAAKFRKRKD